jgi:hypothetical protein
MPIDSDPIISQRNPPESLAAIMIDIAGNVQYKLFTFIFLVFLVINTVVFIVRVLSKMSGAVNVKQPTSWGVFLQAMILVMLCMGMDALIHQKII